MVPVPPDLSRRFAAVLERNGVAENRRRYYHKWLRYCLDFCHKYRFDPLDRDTFGAFDSKLPQKNQAEFLRKQAHHALSLYHTIEPVASDRAYQPSAPPTDTRCSAPDGQARPRENPSPSANTTSRADSVPTPAVFRPAAAHAPAVATHLPQRESSQGRNRPANVWNSGAAPRHAWAPEQAVSRESTTTGASWEWVFEKLESAIRVRHYSPKTLKAYRTWTRTFQTHLKSKDPASIVMADVRAFLSFLAVEKGVSASSQNQAFNALLFLFRHVLEKKFERIEGVVRAKRKPYVPVVL